MSYRKTVQAALPALLGLLLTASVGMAKDGRDFAGHYSIGGVSEQGDQVQLTLSLQLFNYSGADVKGATITLCPAGPNVDVLARFAPVSLWRTRTGAKLSQQVTIPRHEYDMLMEGTQPNLRIVYTDAHGQTWEKTAQLSPRPAGLF
jgi:hypothetical protein